MDIRPIRVGFPETPRSDGGGTNRVLEEEWLKCYPWRHRNATGVVSVSAVR